MTTIETTEVFDAIRRGYSDFANASDEEILDYFDAVDANALTGHISNIKGILFEQEYVEALKNEGINAELFETTNHPDSDISVFDENGNVIETLQLKATDDPNYISKTLETLPDDVTMVVTSEVADSFSKEVVDSGISDTLLEEAVSDAIVPVSPISIIGWFFGIF